MRKLENTNRGMQTRTVTKSRLKWTEENCIITSIGIYIISPQFSSKQELVQVFSFLYLGQFRKLNFLLLDYKTLRADGAKNIVEFDFWIIIAKLFFICNFDALREKSIETFSQL